MTWLTLLKTLLSLALTIADYVRDRQLMDAGEAKATAKALTEIAARLNIGEEIRAEVAAMSDEEAIKEAMDT